MTYYDVKKIEKLFKDYPDAQEISVGMAGDWFWTAVTVWKNGKQTDHWTEGKDGDKVELAGLTGSYCDRPLAEIEFKDGTFKREYVGRDGK